MRGANNANGNKLLFGSRMAKKLKIVQLSQAADQEILALDFKLLCQTFALPKTKAYYAQREEERALDLTSLRVIFIGEPMFAPDFDGTVVNIIAADGERFFAFDVSAFAPSIDAAKNIMIGSTNPDYEEDFGLDRAIKDFNNSFKKLKTRGWTGGAWINRKTVLDQIQTALDVS